MSEPSAQEGGSLAGGLGSEEEVKFALWGGLQMAEAYGKYTNLLFLKNIFLPKVGVVSTSHLYHLESVQKGGR